MIATTRCIIPFTSPVDEDLAVPGTRGRAVVKPSCWARFSTNAYDAVINGVELPGGSIRIHRRDVQRLVFKALGMTPKRRRGRALVSFSMRWSIGTPPHGGIASGIERLLMVLVPHRQHS